MDTLHDRLAELADDAPTGGAPAAELWARGKRAHRLRAAALAATLLVVGAVGTGIGVRLADGDGNRSGPEPAGTVGIALPIEYPVGEELPDLGDTPGPLAAIWLAPRVGGGAPEAVGLVAETGTFGTLPIDVSGDHPADPDTWRSRCRPTAAGSPIDSPKDELVVRDLVSGESYSPTFEEFKDSAPGYTWVDATHLVGQPLTRTEGADADGWAWEPGTAPKLVDVTCLRRAALPRRAIRRDGPVVPHLRTEVADRPDTPAGQSLRRDRRAPDRRAGVVRRRGRHRSEILLGHWNPTACLGLERPERRRRDSGRPGHPGADLRSKTRPCVTWSPPQERLSGSRSPPI